MSRSFRKTVAALAFSEAAAGMILANGPGEHPDIQESARMIKKYCDDAYLYFKKKSKYSLLKKDIKRFDKCMEKIKNHFRDGQRIDAQKMIGFCCFLLDEPIQSIKSAELVGCLQSIADLLVWVQGILETRDGADTYGPISEADEAFKIWRDSGWI